MKLDYLQIGQINRSHTLLSAVREECGGNFREPPMAYFTDNGLLDFAAHDPIHVHLNKGRYECIGGVRLFRLLQACRDQTVIPVLLHEGLKKQMITDMLRLDMLVVPALQSVVWHDIGRLGEAWHRLVDSEFFNRVIARPGTDSLATLIGCDPRTTSRLRREFNNQTIQPDLRHAVR